MVPEACMNVLERFVIGKALINDISDSDRPKYANSCRKFELLAVEDFCKVDVEEVEVKPGLHQSSCDSYGIHHVLRKVSIYPVGKVQSTIKTQSGQVVRCNCLRLASTLQHEQLGENGDRFEIYGECPEDFTWLERVVEYQRKKEGWPKEVFNLERVNGGVVRWTETVFHEVEDVTTAANEENLHHEIVNRYPAEQQVDVACHEHKGVESLCLEGNTPA